MIRGRCEVIVFLLEFASRTSNDAIGSFCSLTEKIGVTYFRPFYVESTSEKWLGGRDDHVRDDRS